MLKYIMLLVGFALLVKGADVFVDGASSIAKKAGIPPVIVGLTIVSIGTSAPELAVSIISSIKGQNDLAIGNVIGSNLFNTLVVLGVTAMIMPILIDKKKVQSDFIVNTVTIILLFVFTFGKSKSNTPLLSRTEGIILLLICAAYMTYLVIKARKMDVEEATEEEKNIKIGIKIILIIIGAIAIVGGGELVVSCAKAIAKSFGMSEKLVGLTVVAMGTSLPELVTSVVAALKGENDICLGNVLGSNIMNVLLILGTSAAICPVTVDSSLAVDFLVLVAVTLLLYALAFYITKKRQPMSLSRGEGALLTAIYIAYMVYIIMRK